MSELKQWLVSILIAAVIGVAVVAWVAARSPQLHTDYSNPEAVRTEFENIFRNMQEKVQVITSTPSLDDCEEGNIYVVLTTATGAGTAFTRLGDNRYSWNLTKL